MATCSYVCMQAWWLLSIVICITAVAMKWKSSRTLLTCIRYPISWGSSPNNFKEKGVTQVDLGKRHLHECRLSFREVLRSKVLLSQFSSYSILVQDWSILSFVIHTASTMSKWSSKYRDIHILSVRLILCMYRDSKESRKWVYFCMFK